MKINWTTKNIGKVAYAGTTYEGTYYEVRTNGEVWEDLGGSFNRIHNAASGEAGKTFVEKRTAPYKDEDFPNGFTW